MFEEIEGLIDKAREYEELADDKLKELLPEGRIIVFRCGNMTINHNATVIKTRVHHWPMVYIKNDFTGKERKIRLEDIKGF